MVVGDGPSSELLRDAPLSALFDTPLQVLSSGSYRQVLPASATASASASAPGDNG